jgi:hypothetical protein
MACMSSRQFNLSGCTRPARKGQGNKSSLTGSALQRQCAFWPCNLALLDEQHTASNCRPPYALVSLLLVEYGLQLFDEDLLTWVVS